MRDKAAELFEPAEMRAGGEYREAARQPSGVGGGECRHGHTRGLRLRQGIRRGEEVPRNPTPHGRTGKQQHGARVSRPERSRYAEVVLITAGQMLLTRSLMFVPGSKQRMIDKSLGMKNLDVAMYDIEDGVAPQEKPLARTLVAEMLGRPRQPRARRASCGSTEWDLARTASTRISVSYGPGSTDWSCQRSTLPTNPMDRRGSRPARKGERHDLRVRADHCGDRKRPRVAECAADSHRVAASPRAPVWCRGLCPRSTSSIEPGGRSSRAAVRPFVVRQRCSEWQRGGARRRMARHR